jgi:hypothetical protein
MTTTFKPIHTDGITANSLSLQRMADRSTLVNDLDVTGIIWRGKTRKKSDVAAKRFIRHLFAFGISLARSAGVG